MRTWKCERCGRRLKGDFRALMHGLLCVFTGKKIETR